MNQPGGYLRALGYKMKKIGSLFLHFFIGCSGPSIEEMGRAYFKKEASFIL